MLKVLYCDDDVVVSAMNAWSGGVGTRDRHSECNIYFNVALARIRRCISCITTWVLTCCCCIFVVAVE